MEWCLGPYFTGVPLVAIPYLRTVLTNHFLGMTRISMDRFHRLSFT